MFGFAVDLLPSPNQCVLPIRLSFCLRLPTFFLLPLFSYRLPKFNLQSAHDMEARQKARDRLDKARKHRLHLCANPLLRPWPSYSSSLRLAVYFLTQSLAFLSWFLCRCAKSASAPSEASLPMGLMVARPRSRAFFSISLSSLFLSRTLFKHTCHCSVDPQQKFIEAQGRCESSRAFVPFFSPFVLHLL